MELWDIINKSGEKSGCMIARGERLRFGQYHLVVHIWIFDDSGRLLIQRRALGLELMPGQWAATGGSAIAGEDSESAAQRELFEELGINTVSGEMVKTGRLIRKNSLVDLWILHRNISMDELSLQKEEVAEVKWVTRGGLTDMIRGHTFHDYGKGYFDMLFPDK